MKKIFYWRFSRKIEGEFWIFYKRFPWEKNWMEEIFKGISLKNWSWIHTRASLARAVFSFKTFFDCEWRSHLLSPTTSTSWNENERSEWLWSESEWVKWSEVSEVKNFFVPDFAETWHTKSSRGENFRNFRRFWFCSKNVEKNPIQVWKSGKILQRISL